MPNTNMTSSNSTPINDNFSVPPVGESIAVIGIGCWYPGARNAVEMWENILARRRAFRRMPDERLPLADYYDPDPLAPEKTYGQRAALIDGFEFDWVGRRFPKQTYESTDIAQWLALEIAISALDDAGYVDNAELGDRTAVVVGNTLTGEHTRSNSMRFRWPYVRKALLTAANVEGVSEDIQQSLADTMEELYKSAFPPITEDTLAGGLANTIAGRICNYFDFHGGGYNVDGACSSSLLAVCQAASHLSVGDADMVVAGGVDISLDAFELVGFAKTGALTANGMHVYGKNAQGFLPGEGSGFVVMKRLSDARAAGDKIYAVLHGWGISSDGKGGITRPSSSGQATAILRAYNRAGYGADTLSFVEGHGTGTPVGDKIELTAMAAAITESNPEAALRTCGMTSLKSIVGHCKAAAGVGAFIKAVMAANRRVIPPTAGMDEATDVFDNEARPLYPVQFGEVVDPAQKIRVGVSAMGFGGINTHVTLESGDYPLAELMPTIDERALLVSNQQSELFVFGASTFDELTEQISTLAPIALEISEAEMVDLAKELSTQIGSNPKVRATVVAESPEQLAERLAELQDVLGTVPPDAGQFVSNPSQTLWVGNGVQKRRLGFLFPGQGAQQLAMARTLVERYSWARDLVAKADQWIQEVEGTPISPFVFRPLDRAADEESVEDWMDALSETQIAQPAICLASIIYAQHLANLGLRPTVVGGHSLGELTALYIAGVFDAETLIKLAAYRGHAMMAAPERPGTMAVLLCSREEASALIEQASGYVVVANNNSPRQIVISGEVAAVKEVSALAHAHDIKTIRIPVSNAFHSELVADAAEKMKSCPVVSDQAAKMEMSVISGMDGQPLEPGFDILDYLSSQIRAEVDFVSLLESMEPLCDQMIEVGPGGILSGLAKATLGEDGVGCLAVASKPNHDLDLNKVLAKAFALGVNVRWETLYAQRLIRPFVPASERIFIDNPCERRLVSSKADVSGIEVIATPTRSLNGSAQRHAGPESATMAEAGSVEALLLEMAQQQTGFPAEAIPMNSRLLDDLNLDSIKAAAYIAGASNRIGIPNALDPAKFANATIGEIAAELEALQSQSGVALPAGLAADTAQQKAPDWVRNFALHYVQQDADDGIAIDWTPFTIMVVDDGDESADTLALCEDLMATGATVKTTSYHSLLNQTGQPDPRVTHWIAVLPRRQDSTAPVVDQLQQTMERVRALAIPAGATTTGDAPIIAYVQFGNACETSGSHVASVDGGLAAGFAKTLHHERPDLRVRVIDFAPDAVPDALGNCIIPELKGSAGFAMASYNSSLNRFVPEVRLQQPTRYTSRDIRWSADDVILATGGAKGITAECMLALAQRTGVKLALVGSSPAPLPDDTSSEIAQTLQRCKEEGITARYYSCNITDEHAVLSLVATVQHELGSVTGVVHGAGVNHPRLIQQVALDDALKEVSPKLLGAANLLQALESAPPKLFVAFTSIIGVTGMPGNAWYAFSNETLAQMLRRFSTIHAETTSVAVAYSVWDEVGMGARMGSVEKLDQMGIGAIPVEEGVKRFLQLVEGDPETDEVIVTARLGGLDTWPAREVSATDDLRFIETIGQLEPDVMLNAQAHLTLDRDLYVQDHIYQGSYLFPTVFGLEAMSQAVACVTGTRNPEIIRIEDIMLERPVIVDPAGGATIGLSAMVGEENEAGERAIRVQIGTEHTAFVEPHFAATLIVGQIPAAPQDAVTLDEPLDILAQRDLYGDLLFQGPLFQRMGQIRTMNDKYCVLHSYELPPAALPELGFPMGHGTHVVLGDAMARDLLLQSIQLIIPQDRCLPIGIERIERFAIPDDVKAKDNGKRIVVPELIEKIDRDYLCDVVTTTEDGFVVERLTGYRVRILEERPDYPNALELAAPGERDATTFAQALANAAEQIGIANPESRTLVLAHLPDLQEENPRERVSQMRPTVERGLRMLMATDDVPTFELEADASGQPMLNGEQMADVELSAAYDDNYLLCGLGRSTLGCEIQPVEHVDQAVWETMFGAHSPLLHELMHAGDEMSIAAARLLVVTDTLAKVTDSADVSLRIVQHQGEAALFEAVYANEVAASATSYIATFPVDLVRKPTRLVAFTVLESGLPSLQSEEVEGAYSNSLEQSNILEQSNGSHSSNTFHTAASNGQNNGKTTGQNGSHVNGQRNNHANGQRNGHANGHANKHVLKQTNGHGNGNSAGHANGAVQAMIDRMTDPDTHRVRLTHDGPEGQAVYELRFQASFKDAASLSRKVYFSQFISWIGKVRELPMKEIAPGLMRDFLTGEWGMVTNSTSLRVVGEATSYDTIQARVWVGEVVNSSFVTRIEFSKVLDDESTEIIAHGEVWATWVRLVSYGVPSPRPFPTYVDDYLTIFAAPEAENHSEEALRTGISTLDLGAELYRKPAGLSQGPAIGTQTFQTTLEEANLVGNVYYGNYFIWQGRVRDLFLYNVAPHYLRDSVVQSEMVCLYTRMDYLREAMPFDKVRAAGFVESVSECGAVLSFEFYRENPNGELEKLSVGRQEIAWVKRDEEGNPLPTPWPEDVLAALTQEAVSA